MKPSTPTTPSKPTDVARLSPLSRVVNTLEQRVATSLTSDLAMIRRSLEEREREEHLRPLIARRKAAAVVAPEGD